MPSTHEVGLLSQSELDSLREAVALGFENAALGLSDMVGRAIQVVAPSLRLVPIAGAPDLVGKPDEEVVTIYLEVSGEASGHILLILSPVAADQLLEMILGPREKTIGLSIDGLDELDRSALGEVGNITSSFFLSALGNATDLLMQPSPPAVMIDFAGATLDIPIMSIGMTMEELLIIDTWFIDDDHHIEGLFLMLPAFDSLKLIMQRLGH